MAIVTLDGGSSSQALGGQVIEYVTNLVLMQIPGVPDQLARTQLGLVLREFYEKSTAFRDDVGPYLIQQGRSIVQLNPVSQDVRIQFVLDAYLFPYQGSDTPQPLAPLTRKPLGGSPQPPSSYYMQEMDQMLLYPTPDQTYGKILYVYAALVPLSTAVVLPDVAYTHHVDALQWGTMSRLLSMSKKPWTDKQQAAAYDRKYRQEIMLRRDIANRGSGPADTRIQFPLFAGRGGSQVLPRATG
jgi:hypothetical protein